MKIERNFTKDGQDAYADLAFKATTSEIRNPDGTIVFKLEKMFDITIPREELSPEDILTNAQYVQD